MSDEEEDPKHMIVSPPHCSVPASLVPGALWSIAAERPTQE